MNGATAVVEAEIHGDQVVVRVSGELDIFNAEPAAKEIEQAIPTQVHGAAIDLTDVGFVDSTAIRKLFGLNSRLAERRQRMVIVTPDGSTVQRTLQLVAFARAAPMLETLEEALKELEAKENVEGAP